MPHHPTDHPRFRDQVDVARMIVTSPLGTWPGTTRDLALRVVRSHPAENVIPFPRKAPTAVAVIEGGRA
ncbi:hypothetical protein [Maritimibacter sp. DP1N21-5]|uniref:hypothetical protein n=1 Tax=Maritimibacter sp. DP1N21-5 TaxID=2836867 RepID=UPI001C48E877|nr:hypothetical protein [Maritimibacter sp. DP1N21-5]MBV7408181.1 hypothetical protein [Maritimibacter sp. DP1N21-5]